MWSKNPFHQISLSLSITIPQVQLGCPPNLFSQFFAWTRMLLQALLWQNNAKHSKKCYAGIANISILGYVIHFWPQGYSSEGYSSPLQFFSFCSDVFRFFGNYFEVFWIVWNYLEVFWILLELFWTFFELFGIILKFLECLSGGKNVLKSSPLDEYPYPQRRVICAKKMQESNGWIIMSPCVCLSLCLSMYACTNVSRYICMYGRMYVWPGGARTMQPSEANMLNKGGRAKSPGSMPKPA